jgi:cAMP phosphodiesterase
MKDGSDETSGAGIGLHGHRPALQVVCLGSGGGPSEEEVTGLLVRSIASDWTKNSLLAVDAGSHLAPIIKILEKDFPSISPSPLQGNGIHAGGLSRTLGRASLSPSPGDEDEGKPKVEPTILSSGPFAGLKFPWASARANALHVVQTYVRTYLITHAHLDHLSGFAINTAAFHSSTSAKTLAALPSTVAAVKDHIFNDIIWPNLTDEDGGVGFVTFQRLKEGGDIMMGEGESRGYIDVCDGLGVKAFKVSHGVCTRSPPSHYHRGSIAGLDNLPPYNGSISGTTHGEHAGAGMQRSNSQFSAPGTPVITPRPSFYQSQRSSPRMNPTDSPSCVVDSTAFFIRDTSSHREVLIFGDVEPDPISLSPRNHYVWAEAARKIAFGILGGIFIECSYDDSQPDSVLFGHLNPRHLIAELQTLAHMVSEAKASRHFEKGVKKRKRSAANGLETAAQHAISEKDRKRSRSLASRSSLVKDSRRSSVPDHSMPDAQTHGQLSSSPSADNLNQIQYEHMEHSHHGPQEPVSPKAVKAPPANTANTGVQDLPLAGIKVVVIHIKDTMKDGPHVRDNILAQLQDYEQRLQLQGEGLGCEFVISRSGESYWF